MKRRTFLKGLVGSAASASLSMSGCSFLVRGPEKIDPIADFIHRRYWRGHERARENNQYVIDYLRDRTEILELIKSPIAMKDNLLIKLQKLEHVPLNESGHARDYDSLTKGTDVKIFHSDLEYVRVLNPRQLIRAYLLTELLEDKKVVANVGGQVEEDLKDKKSEWGGIVLLDGSNFHRLEADPNSSVKRLEVDPDQMYLPPKAYFNDLSLAVYHFHATMRNDTWSTGPSIYLGEKGLEGDIANMAQTIRVQGETHSVVITKLKGKKFNACYSGGELDVLLRPEIIVLSLGNYSYAA